MTRTAGTIALADPKEVATERIAVALRSLVRRIVSDCRDGEPYQGEYEPEIEAVACAIADIAVH